MDYVTPFVLFTCACKIVGAEYVITYHHKFADISFKTYDPLWSSSEKLKTLVMEFPSYTKFDWARWNVQNSKTRVAQRVGWYVGRMTTSQV